MAIYVLVIYFELFSSFPKKKTVLFRIYINTRYRNTIAQSIEPNSSIHCTVAVQERAKLKGKQPKQHIPKQCYGKTV